jgi:hypothetical protein
MQQFGMGMGSPEVKQQPLIDGTNPPHMVGTSKLQSRKGKNLALDFDANATPKVSSGGHNSDEMFNGKKLGNGDQPPNLLQATNSRSKLHKMSNNFCLVLNF